jgi:hypothetical protein
MQIKSQNLFRNMNWFRAGASTCALEIFYSTQTIIRINAIFIIFNIFCKFFEEKVQKLVIFLTVPQWPAIFDAPVSSRVFKYR